MKTGVSLCVHLLGGSDLRVITARNRATLSDFDLSRFGLVLVYGYDIAFLQPGDLTHPGANGERAENEV